MPALTPGLALGPDWTVDAYAPGARLVLKKDAAGDRARARGAATVGVGALVTAAALVSATPSGLALVTWPVAALLGVVAVLAVPAAVRSVRRARSGVTLEATTAGVAGWPVAVGALHDLRAARRQVAAADVAEVSVRQAAHPPLTLWMLEVRLRDGSALAGPEVATPDGAPPPLDAAADALREILDRPTR